jgi:alpha-beta hydrolase superfamily lysophospholipase
MRAKFSLSIFLLCSLLLFTGCGPQFTPVQDPVLAEPQLNETSFISFDGTELPLRTWLPPGGIAAAKSIIIGVHGFNDYYNFIKRGAAYFNARHIAVYAYDQRGFGNAPVWGRWSSSDAMAQDLKTLVQLMAQKHAGLPVYLLGHSMGGAVVIHAMAGENHPDAAGAILVAPAVWARSTIPFYQTGGLWLAAHTVPWYTVTGESLDRQACSDIEVLREQGRDPLVIKKTRFDTIYGLQNLMDAAYADAERYSLKTLVLYGLHDEIIPQEPVLDAYRHFPDEPGEEKKLILYKNGYHMLLRDLQAEDVMQDIVAWINQPEADTETADN